MMIDLSQIPVLCDLPDALSLAEQVTVAAGTTLFAEGDAPRYAWMRLSGHCMLSQDAAPLGEARSGELLDALAVLGGIVHSQRAIAITECQFVRWELAQLEQHAPFQRVARAYLAGRTLHAETRNAELEAPIHFVGDGAEVAPGPYVFDHSTLLFLFCDAYVMDVALPAGLSAVSHSALIVLAQFRGAHAEAHPQARFSYTETTCFIPVRYGVRPGLYVAQIYPSTWEPILIGREVYGFPKRPGRTALDAGRAELVVDGERLLRAQWSHQQSASEAQLVGAFGTCFGVQGRLTAGAFAIGDMLLAALRVPFYRRVSVFNHKRIAATVSRSGAALYDVDQLTEVIFSVQRWNRIERVSDAALDAGGVLQGWHIHLREAYLTQADIRLSTGRVVRDYRANRDGR